MRAGNMPFAVQALTLAQVHQIVTTIENNPFRIIEMRRQIGSRNQHVHRIILFQ